MDLSINPFSSGQTLRRIVLSIASCLGVFALWACAAAAYPPEHYAEAFQAIEARSFTVAVATIDRGPYEEADLPSTEIFSGLEELVQVEADSYWIGPEFIPSALHESYLPFYKEAMADGDVLVFIAPPDPDGVVSLFGIQPEVQIDGSKPKAVYLWQTTEGDVRVGQMGGGAEALERSSLAGYLYQSWQHQDHLNRNFPNSGF